MINVSISYGMALKLSSYMEREIKECGKEYRTLSNHYQETENYNRDMESGKRSFWTNYGTTEMEYEERKRELRIRQYQTYLELKEFAKSCKEQNGGKPYLSITNGIIRELICFNPSYDNVEKELERLKEERGY